MGRRKVTVIRVIVCALACVVVLSSSATRGSLLSANEQRIWELEHAYWRYVQENDLGAYLNLWHKDFLGWPYVSEAPVRKDHITDWMTSRTSRGQAFRLVEFKPAAMQMSGDLAVAYYWVRFEWVDKSATKTESTLRVTHTWIKTASDWQIVGGMSMPEPADAHK